MASLPLAPNIKMARLPKIAKDILSMMCYWKTLGIEETKVNAIQSTIGAMKVRLSNIIALLSNTESSLRMLKMEKELME